MKVEEKGLYKARNGEIFYINSSFSDYDEGPTQWTLSADIEMSPLTWFENGQVYLDQEHELDLVERII
jgi:hypothetical protein